MPPLTADVDRWSDGGSDEGDGTVPTPRGTTQVVTRGKLIIIIAGLDRWQVRIRGMRYCSFGYEVVVWQWRLRGTVAIRGYWIEASGRLTCHHMIGSRANDWREEKAIMTRLLGLNDKNAPRSGALIG
ncbi:hypothetical protein Tco_1022106 [Tanacetum coccineum]